MPQVRGTGSWLANPRQDAPHERVRLDYSSQHLDNDRIGEESKREVESINNQRHRALADRAYLIKETRDAIRRLTHMQMLIKRNEVETFLRNRREDFKKNVEETEQLPDRTKDLSVQGNGKERPKTSGAPGGTAKIRPKTTPVWKRAPTIPVRRPTTATPERAPAFATDDIKDGDLSAFKEAFLRTEDPKWQTTALPVTNGSRRPRRPQTSCQPRSRVEIRNSLMAEFSAKNAQGGTRTSPQSRSVVRPKTCIGLTRGREDDDDIQLPSGMDPTDEEAVAMIIGGEPSQMLYNTPTLTRRGSRKPARQKLPKLSEMKRAMVRDHIRGVRQKQLAHEDALLQERIRNFYKGIHHLAPEASADGVDKLSPHRHHVFTYYK